jgi:hypothetical protein
LALVKDARQLVVIEAKMSSGLSKGVKRCAVYDQASRTVACIAEVLARASAKPDGFQRLAFFVVAPSVQISAGIFGDRLSKATIECTVRNRVEAYVGARDEWFNGWFQPTLAASVIQLLSWEQALEGLPDELHQFYARCIEFNRPAKS